jgi:hypothetical protein
MFDSFHEVRVFMTDKYRSRGYSPGPVGTGDLLVWQTSVPSKPPKPLNYNKTARRVTEFEVDDQGRVICMHPECSEPAGKIKPRCREHSR